MRESLNSHQECLLVIAESFRVLCGVTKIDLTQSLSDFFRPSKLITTSIKIPMQFTCGHASVINVHISDTG